MRKSQPSSADKSPPRVLARLLAEELEVVRGANGCTPKTFLSDSGRVDTTNLESDNDGCDY